MTLEISLIKYFTNKDKYNNYKLVKNEYLDKHTKNILEAYQEYFSTFSVTDIDLNDFKTWFLSVKNTGFKPEVVKEYETIIDNANKTTPDDSIIKPVIDKEFYNNILELTLKGLEDGKDYFSDIKEELKTREDTSILEEDKRIVVANMSDLADTVVGAGGLDWRLDWLNESVGPLRKGTFMVIGARPEVGKTTFLASEATFMAPQLKDDEYVIWFNNEEEGKKVKWRVIQAALGWTNEAMRKNLGITKTSYEAAVGRLDRILIYDSASIYPHNVENILKKYKPGLIIFDQLRKLHGFNKSDNDVSRLQKLYQFGREIAKEYAPVITVHQADASAEGASYVDMHQLYGSKTEIQGEADVILTIGATHKEGYEDVRHLYLPKNKMAGGPRTKEEYRHGKYDCTIKRTTARYV